MTSTWMTFAPASRTIAIWSFRRPKSAARMLGAMPLIWARACSTGNARRYIGPCSTCARSSNVPHNWDTRNAARSGGGSSHSGSGRAGWSGAATVHGTRDTPIPLRHRSRAHQLRDEETVGAVAVRERLQELRHGRMLPDGTVAAQVNRPEIRVNLEKAADQVLVLDRRDRAGRVNESTAGP